LASCLASSAPRAARATGISPRVTAALVTAVAAVWLTHGLYNKLLGGSPRHLAIVQSVPGLEGPAGERLLTLIGVAEVALAAWVASGATPRLCASVQTVALLAMNVVELRFASHLLLWPAALVPVNVAFLSLAWLAAAAPRTRRLRTWLKRHPIPIEAHFNECITLTYALPADVLIPLLPPGLQLDTRHGYGFVAVALVQTEALRPAGWPKTLGQRFFLAGYRVFVKFRTPGGHVARGLRILRSDADRWRMVVGGNLLTHYNYHRCQAAIVRPGDRIRIEIATDDGSGNIDIVADPSQSTLPPGSPFASAREARYFAGPLPFTFDYEEGSHAIIAIEAVRTRWKPAPIGVDVRHLSFFDLPAFQGCRPILAAAFRVSNIDYRWQRGVYYPLAPGAHR
jgi:uncharacterized membrane protein YphA (DoxX/SURF4 family)